MSSLPPRRLLLALLSGAVYVSLLLVFFPPGRFDLPPIRVAGTAAIDETYWSAPVRDLMGAGRMEPYDQGLALSLALPQNAVGAAAGSLGAPVDVARVSGSLLAAFALAAMAVLFGGWRGAALAVLLANPVVWGHLASDLGEGPAFAIVVGWLFAASRGAWGLAAFLAGLGVFQKGCGLFLGVGCLAAVVVARDRLARLARCALGVALGVGTCVLVAWAVFGDSPLAFLARPWTTTADVRPVPGASVSAWLGHLVQTAFAGYHGAGPALAVILIAAFAASRASQPGASALAALVAGFAYYAAFPDPQRLVPLVPLLVLPAFPTSCAVPDRVAGRGAWVLTLLLAPQVAAATVGFVGLDAPAWALLAATVVLLAVGWAWRERPLSRQDSGLPLAVSLAAMLVLAVFEPGIRTEDLHRLADSVAARVPRDAGLVASPVLGLRHRGTLWYRDFEPLWRDDLARAKPSRLFRVRGVAPDAPPRPPDPPEGFVPAANPILLGRFPYSWDSRPVDVLLEEFRPSP